MNQKLSKLNQTSRSVEHTVALKKFIYNSSQRYVIFMQDVRRNCVHEQKGRGHVLFIQVYRNEGRADSLRIVARFISFRL